MFYSALLLASVAVVGFAAETPCADDPLACFGVKAAVALDRLGRSAGSRELLPGVTLTETRSARQLSPPLDEESLRSSLPTDQEGRVGRLLEVVARSVTDFLENHSITIKAPAEGPEGWARALDEGRARIKKKMLPILLLVGAKLVALLPLAIGLVGIMALKALFVGKLAFVIAAVIAFQKFFAGGGSLTSFVKSPEVAWNNGGAGWSNTGGSSGGPYYRSFDAHDLAYSAQQPSQQLDQ